MHYALSLPEYYQVLARIFIKITLVSKNFNVHVMYFIFRNSLCFFCFLAWLCAVQRQFIPELWQDLKCGLLGGRYGFRPRDICVSAPTGSGKTLAYVLPIVQVL